MPIARFQMPDGRVARFEVPDGTTPEQAQGMMSAHFNAPQEPEQKPSPTDGMSGMDNAVAAFGGLLPKALAGIQQRATDPEFIKGVSAMVPGGLAINELVKKLAPERYAKADEKRATAHEAINADINETRRLKEPLMQTLGGKIGDFAGNVALAVPTAAIPGANTVAGATAIGGLLGLLQPTADGESAGTNAAFGAAGGPAGILLGRTAGQATKAVKSALEPFYDKGKEAIIARFLKQTAGEGADQAAAQLSKAAPIVPGSAPTVAQASGNPGLAALERTAGALDPNAYTARATQQNEARVNALRAIAGDDLQLQAAQQARKLVTAPSYAQVAKSQEVVDPTRAVNIIDGMMEKNPGNRQLANNLFDIRNTLFDDGTIRDNPQALKSAVDNIKSLMSKKGPTGSPENEFIIRELGTVKKALESSISKAEPAYGKAQKDFRGMSAPINQMEVGRELLKSTRALDNVLKPEAFAKALRNGDATAARATGFKRAKLDSVMDPDQVAILNSIKDDLARSQFAQNAGRGPGSDTVQKLAYSNMMDRAGIPSFVKKNALGQILGGVAGRVGDAAYGRANKELSQLLSEIMLDPQRAGLLMQQVAKPSALNSRYAGLLTGPGAALTYSGK